LNYNGSQTYNSWVQIYTALLNGRNSNVPNAFGMQEKMQDKLRAETDHYLIDRIKNKDKAALREIYSRFSQAVFNLAFRMLGDRENAEEVVQDIFLQVWNKAQTYERGRGAVSTWIINIARSRSIDKLRTLGYRDRNTELDEEKLNSSTDFSRILEDREEKKNVIEKALYGLPQNQRDVIELVYFEGFTHVEAAEELNEPIGTIKTRLRLGVIKLKEKMAPYVKELK
jgi:RNA polymerase sigma-70 factor, ECF subfamily